MARQQARATKAAASGGERGRAVEWVFGTLSALIVAALLVYFGWSGLFGDDRPPEFVLTIETVERTGTATSVGFIIRNAGDRAASDVVVAAGQEPGTEPHRVTFDYVPGRSERRGSFLFPDAAFEAGDLRLEVESHTIP
jgi:uncharacterized protein (TIGR02588 family)